MYLLLHFYSYKGTKIYKEPKKGQKKCRSPPQETCIVYKTNLTNRHEKILMSDAKVIN